MYFHLSETCPDDSLLDLTIMIDGSDNVRNGPQISNIDNWQRSLEFMARVVERLPVSRQQVGGSGSKTFENGLISKRFDIN